MAQLLSSSRKTYRVISTKEQLIEHLKWAMSLELSTIPPYLTALYSLQDATTPAYDAVKAVSIEEMLHLALVSNLIASVGGRATFDDSTVPEYPTYIPHHAAGGPFIGLQPLSTTVAKDVFCAIEAPSDERNPPPEGDNFETIGQFYAAIELGFETLAGQLGCELFDADAPQLSSQAYFGGGGGKLFEVRDLATAKRAINEIVSQGEGAQPLRPGGDDQPFGGRLHYGDRPDGTYGPILGVGAAPSHYERFTQLADGSVPIGAVWPMQINVRTRDIADPSLRAASELLNQSYSLSLRYIELSYTSDSTLFFRGAVPLMHTVIPALARLLMSSPLDQRTGSVGPNAGPSFEFVAAPSPPSALGDEALRLQNDPPAQTSASTAQSWASTFRALAPFLANLPAL